MFIVFLFDKNNYIPYILTEVNFTINGKTVEKRRRKASDLKPNGNDGRVAEVIKYEGPSVR